MNLTQVALALVAVILTGCASSNAPTTVSPWYMLENTRGDPIHAVYESRVPCADCARTKVALALYRDVKTSAPTTYSLSLVHVAGNPERQVRVHGTWTLKNGTSLDQGASVIHLSEEAPADFRDYWVIGESLLFILDRNLSPRVGDASHGFALNRTK
jgi:hypothetical protein